MLPDVLMSLLHFVHTYCLLLSFNDFDDDDKKEIDRYLLKVVNCYIIKRFKLNVSLFFANGLM